MPGASAKRPELEVYWTSQAHQDREFWGKHDRRALVRIEKLIAEVQEHPFTGTIEADYRDFHLGQVWDEYIIRRGPDWWRLVTGPESGY